MICEKINQGTRQSQPFFSVCICLNTDFETKLDLSSPLGVLRSVDGHRDKQRDV